jgi:hypothetical protein
MSRFYLSGLRSVVQTVALPYGYTVTVWSSGQELIHRRGMPRAWEVFLFAAGAVVGFASLRALTRVSGASAAPRVGSTPDGARGVLIQIIAIGAAVGSATLIGRVASAVVWPFGGYAATALYLAVVALEPALRSTAADTST